VSNEIEINRANRKAKVPLFLSGIKVNTSRSSTRALVIGSHAHATGSIVTNVVVRTLASALTVSRAAATTAAFAVFAVTSVTAALTLAISVLGPVTPVAARVKPAVVSFRQGRRRGRWGWWRAHGRGRTQTTLSFRGVVVAGSWASHL
jgi:hypothetical protein